MFGTPVYKTMSKNASWAQRLGSYIFQGGMHTVGAELIEATAKGNRYNLLGYEQFFGKKALGPVPTGRYHPMSAGEKFFTGASVLGTAMTVMEGYSSGGIMGAIGAGFSDVAVNAAIVSHGYKYSKNAAGIKSLGPKQGMLGTFARYGMGSSFAIAGREMMGGGVLGFGGSLVGGYLGVRAGIPLTLGWIGYQGAKLAGKGAVAVAKEGYRYRQRQKQIQTSGSLAAFHTQGAQTMRARAVSAIHKSHLNARSALGQEAQYMHFPSRSYHSRYRMV